MKFTKILCHENLELYGIYIECMRHVHCGIHLRRDVIVISSPSNQRQIICNRMSVDEGGGVMDKQTNYMTLFGVHSTMHLMHLS